MLNRMEKYSASFEKAYAEIDEFNLKNCFPGGKPHAQRIVDSYRFLLQKKDLDERVIFELQRAIGVRIIMGFDNERIKITLNISYSDVVEKSKQDPLIAFVRSSLTNPNVTLVSTDLGADSYSNSDIGFGQQDGKKPSTVRDGPNGEIQEAYQFENLNEFMAYVPLSKAKGVSVVWVKGTDYTENFTKGYQLLDEKRYLEAIPLYKRCLEVNPVAFRSRLELITCYTMLGQYGKAHEQIDALAQFRMPKSILAAFYRRYGYLLAEEGKNLESYACYQYSLRFESSDLARGEIQYLSSIMRKELVKYDPEKIMKKKGIPVLQSMPDVDPSHL